MYQKWYALWSWIEILQFAGLPLRWEALPFLYACISYELLSQSYKLIFFSRSFFLEMCCLWLVWQFACHCSKIDGPTRKPTRIGQISFGHTEYRRFLMSVNSSKPSPCQIVHFSPDPRYSLEYVGKGSSRNGVLLLHCCVTFQSMLEQGLCF